MRGLPGSRVMEAESKPFMYWPCWMKRLKKKKSKRLTSKARDSMRSGNHFGCCNEDCGDRAILVFFNLKSQNSIQCLIHKYEQLVAFVILFKERVV